MKELNDFRKFIQENELHEGTWSLGSAQNMIAAISQLEGMMREDNPAAWMQAFEDLDSILYRTFGDDGFHDALSVSKTAVEDGDIDRAKNALSDAIGIAQKLLAFQVKQNAENLEEENVEDTLPGEEGYDSDALALKGIGLGHAKLEENDAVLDELSNSMGIFKEIDMMIGSIKDQMSPDDAFDSLVSEFEAISGGTKLLHRALKNITLDNNLGEIRSAYNESLNEDLTKDILKKHPKKYKDEKAVKAAAAKLMKSPKFRGKGIGPVLQALLKGKE